MQIRPPTLPNGTFLINRYRIFSLLGQGGMSRVYMAEDVRLAIRVAVKENLQTDPNARTQFQTEAHLLAALSQSNLPRVMDHFDDPATGRQYFVMDYIEGEDLAAMVERSGPLPEADIVKWAKQILEALEYLHTQEPPVIHRDIKPANIKITRQGKAVLVDFGIAKTYNPQMGTMTGARAVTPGYAPPEQYGMHTDRRSDLYALGATLYTLATGAVPPEATLRLANLAPVIVPRRLRPELSPKTEQVILRAMEMDPQKRWQTAGEFSAALSQAAPLPYKPAIATSVGDKTQVADSSSIPRLPDLPPKRPAANQRRMLAIIVGVLALCIVSVCVLTGFAYVGPFSPFRPRQTIIVVPRDTPTENALLDTPTEPPLPPTVTAVPLPPKPSPVPPTSIPSLVDAQVVSFIIANNYENPQDFYVDGYLMGTINSAQYAVYQVQRGSHELTNCARGKNPVDNPSNCNSKTATIDRNPFNWEIFGNARPAGDVTFILFSNAHVNADLYMDGKFAASIDSGKYTILRVPTGTHGLQACGRGHTPQEGGHCSSVQNKDIQSAVFMWQITD